MPSCRRGSSGADARLPEGWLVWPENPILLDEKHAPLPDIPVVRGDGRSYVDAGRHPAAADVGLIVEVARTSLPRDLGPRAEAFARAMVAAYWVADVNGRRIIEHRDPRVSEASEPMPRSSPAAWTARSP